MTTRYTKITVDRNFKQNLKVWSSISEKSMVDCTRELADYIKENKFRYSNNNKNEFRL